MEKILPQRSILAYALIFLMVAASVILKNKEIILPEVSALAVGCLIYEHPGWLNRPFHIFLLPSITAIIGFFINTMEINITEKLICTVFVVLITLLVFKSSLAPAFATGLLPVITNATSFYFIFAILAFTFTLFVCMLFKTKSQDKPSILKPKKTGDNIVFTALIILWILICSLNKWMFMAAIPPVWVVAYESIHKEAYTVKIFSKQVICLSLSALTGILGLYLFNNLLLALLFDLAAITLLLRVMKFELTPAYPMALLPMVLLKFSSQYFYLQVLLMAFVVLGSIYLYKKIMQRVNLRKFAR